MGKERAAPATILTPMSKVPWVGIVDLGAAPYGTKHFTTLIAGAADTLRAMWACSRQYREYPSPACEAIGVPLGSLTRKTHLARSRK
jgi:hypothetical protein